MTTPEKAPAPAPKHTPACPPLHKQKAGSRVEELKRRMETR